MNLIISVESGEGESNARPIDLQSIALPSELSPVLKINLLSLEGQLPVIQLPVTLFNKYMYNVYTFLYV